MRMTLNLEDELLNKAMSATGVSTKTEVIHLGLKELIKRKAIQNLVNAGGSDPKAKHIRRNRDNS
tara:strand:- start:594 stop:788 length:195 start_codon:yes stop_codon:yes gene_type:complete